MPEWRVKAAVNGIKAANMKRDPVVELAVIKIVGGMLLLALLYEIFIHGGR